MAVRCYFFQPILYFICETFGVSQTTPSEAGLMIALIPVIVTIMAILFLGERPQRIQLYFILLSVIRVIFIIIMKGNFTLRGNLTGYIFLGGAVFTAGIYNIISRKISLNFKPVEITFGLFSIISFFRFKGDFITYIMPLQNNKVLLTILYLGILSSDVAFFMVNYTLSRIEASRSTVFANLTTIISIFAGIIFRNEPFYWFQILGGLMIFIGVWGTNFYGNRFKKTLSKSLF